MSNGIARFQSSPMSVPTEKRFPEQRDGKPAPPLSAGMRVTCRNAEWLVTRVEPASRTGHHFAVHCTGADDLVRGHEAIFLTQLDKIDPIDPRNTELIPDSSTGYKLSRLFLEARLRQTPATGVEPDLLGQGVFEPMAFQVETVRHALCQLRPRLLLADAVGLGKTIQVGMILTELIRRNRANRILVLAKKSMLAQFQSELWNRFTIPLMRLDSEGIARLRLRIPASKNPFEVYRRIIISIDTLKNVARYEHFLKAARWDVVVIDEAHNVAGASVPERNQSYRLARLLSRRTDCMLLTTATPHNGKRETFGRLISLLDPSVIADPKLQEYGAEEISGFFKMRFKEDIRDQASHMMAERRVISIEKTSCRASAEEERVYSLLAEMRAAAISGRDNGDPGWRNSNLVAYGLYKSFLSSPEACASTTEKRISNLFTQDPDSEELKWLRKLKNLLAPLSLPASSRYSLLLRQLEEMGWKGKNTPRKVLIFTESRRTQDALARALGGTYRLPISMKFEDQPKQTIAVIHGGFPDVHLMKAVEAFATVNSPIKVLIATDVASEGINLHHACHQIIHYDLPWSIITLVQRNGRIDRLGQKHSPELRYLMVNTTEKELSGDSVILKRLITKVEEINRLRQSGESVLKLYDEAEEEAFIAEKGILKGDTRIFDQESVVAAAEASALEEILRQACTIGTTQGKDSASSPPPDGPSGTKRVRLFSDRDFLLDGYGYLRKQNERVYRSLEVTANTITLNAPEDLKRRLGAPDQKGDIVFGATAIPSEAWPESDLFRLTHLPERMQLAIEAARNTSGYWAAEQFCSERHPILQWLTERIIMQIPKGSAPFVVSPYLEQGSLCFCFIGQLSSLGGTPLVVDAHAITYVPGGFMRQEGLHDVLARAQFERLINTGAQPDMKALRPLLHAAVTSSLEYMRTLKDHHIDKHRPLIQQEEARLEAWLRARKRLVSAQMELFGRESSKSKFERQLAEAEDYVRDRRRNWREMHFETSDEPSTQLILVIMGSGG